MPRGTSARRSTRTAPTGPVACRRKFLRFFPRGFRDPKYRDWERDYKWKAHERWIEVLNPREFRALLRTGQAEDIARRAVTIESRTNLLFSFEKMALRDAVRSRAGADRFARALYELLHGKASDRARFERWRGAVAGLPRKQTRVLTWPVLTVFGFIAQPERHFFVKPNVMRRAARAYEFEWDYRSAPDWNTYASVLTLARKVIADQSTLGPRDLIDAQSFLWVQGSDEYD